jgi:hypothetical protein
VRRNERARALRYEPRTDVIEMRGVEGEAELTGEDLENAAEIVPIVG